MEQTQEQLAAQKLLVDKLSTMTDGQVKVQEALIEKITSEYRDEKMQLLERSDQQTKELMQRLAESQNLAQEEKARLAEEAKLREERAIDDAKKHAEEIKKQQAALSGMLAEAKLANGGPYISVTVVEAANLPKVRFKSP